MGRCAAHPKHFRAAFRTDALGGWSPRAGEDRHGLLHFSFLSTFHTIG